MEACVLIEQILDEYKSVLGKDLLKYKNHAYRVYHLATLLDNETKNREKYAIASAFHDLGIWTNNTFDYLSPSIHLAQKWLIQKNKAEWYPEIQKMIDMHHKLSAYKDPCKLAVETFRKADWIDVSYGLLKYEADSNLIKKIFRQYPTSGFHRFLIKKTLFNFLQHPLKPLPMFRI